MEGQDSVGVAVVEVIGQPVLDSDHALDSLDGPDHIGQEAAPLDPALERDHPGR
jgi:hypothetical protein